MSDFLGSIAEEKIKFSVVNEFSTNPGQNFYSVVVYMNGGEAAANLTTPINTGTLTINQSNYQSLAKGPFLDQLVPFFQNNNICQIYVAIYNAASASTVADSIEAVFDKTKVLGFFKLIFSNGASNAFAIRLAKLCEADALLSQFWIGTAEASVKASPLGAGVAKDLVDAKADAVIIYSAQTGINPALAALGVALAKLNSTGTPVGNKISYVATNSVLPSGTTGGLNRSNVGPTEKQNLEKNKVNYFLTVQDQGGLVALNDTITLKNNTADVAWIEKYINFRCQNLVANLLTNPAVASFKSEATYRKILTTIEAEIRLIEEVGRLSNVQITKKSFFELPPSDSKTIIIPNAWSAIFNQTVKAVTVQGSVTIQA